MSNTVHKLRDTIGTGAEKLGRSSTNRAVKLAAKTTKLATDLLDPSKAEIVVKATVTALKEDNPQNLLRIIFNRILSPKTSSDFEKSWGQGHLEC